MNDLSPLFSFSFRLPRHRALHGLRQFQVLQLYDAYLDAPGLSLLVDYLLQLFVNLIPLREHFVQFTLTHNGTERRLRNLSSRMQIVSYVDSCGYRIHDSEVADGIDFHSHIIAGDGLLRLYIQGDHSHIHAHHLIDERDHEDDAGALRPLNTSKAKDHTAFIFRYNLNRCPY